MISDNYFHLNVTGQIKHAHFPLGPDGGALFCRYDVIAGPDWELISGLKCGITQCAMPGKRAEIVTFNMPIEFTFKSTNPYGWPQIIFSLYSQNWWRCETSRGYARIHVPLGGDIRDIHAPLLIPRCINPWAALANWFTGRNPELRDPKVLADSSKTKGLSTQSYGEMVVQLQTICRGGTKMGLDWGQRLASTSSSFS